MLTGSSIVCGSRSARAETTIEEVLSSAEATILLLEKNKNYSAKMVEVEIEPQAHLLQLKIAQEPNPEVSPNESEPETPSESEEQPPSEPQPEVAPEPRVLVGEVVVTGVEGELQDLVYSTIDTRPGRTTSRSQLREDVNAIYARGVFANVRVIPEDTPLGVRITFLVEPNPVLNRVTIQAEPVGETESVVPPEAIEEIFAENYGEIINLRNLQQDIQKLNKWYSQNGYDLAQVVRAPQVSDDGTVTVIVAEGVIEDIQVRFFDSENEPAEGETRDFIITREIELKQGDIFNRNTAQKDLGRVFGLQIFEDVRFSFSPGEDPRKVVVNVDVVEARTGSISAGAGVSTGISGLFGSVSFREQNLGGNNQTVGLNFELGDRQFGFDASFRDPWIAGDPYRTSYGVNAFRRRSLSLVYTGDGADVRTARRGNNPRVLRTGLGVNFNRPLAPTPYEREEWSVSTGFRYQHVEIRDARGNIAPRSETGEKLAFSDNGEDDLTLVRIGAIRDLRDNNLQPSSGSFARLSMEQSIPIGSGSILLNRLRGNYSHYFPVNWIRFTEGPQTIAFNVQAATILGDLPPYEAFVVGGVNSVRGYPDGLVGSGRSYLQATAEYRFPIWRFIGAAIFFDYGTTLGTGSEVPGNPSDVRDLPGSGYGYGIGARIRSPLGPLRIEYAINEDGDDRIQFGVGEKF
ncbi:MAG: BamA/TamA family outer membrane protein [Prochloraceae cyanobacterium]|nr:BamA/TamA family outer membrane protein [Prochloraceae cyanobacterium]